MKDSQVTEKLSMRWVSVTGIDGRTRLEMRWTTPATPTAPAAPTGRPARVHAA
jgi:hypothetical protein